METLKSWSISPYHHTTSMALSILDTHEHTRRKLGSSATVVSYVGGQTLAIQIVATTMAAISVTASVIALYWFCLMRRNYRRDLVLLLVLSDLLKNFCFILFAGVNFNAGPVEDSDTFCQASGYLFQTGLEACDCAIFFIGLHMFLQIFPKPNTIFGYDGLYNVRHWVYALWFCLPNISASLAFINDSYAYAVQGTWCWLPVRPFWYRLALAWVPRYIIATSILVFAIAIYIHVGAEFKLFGKEHGRSPSSDFGSSMGTDFQTGLDGPSSRTVSTGGVQEPMTPEMRGGLPLDDSNIDPFARNMFVSPAIGTALPELRRHSLPTWTSPFEASSTLESGHKRGSQSEAPSRRGSKQVTFDRSAIDPAEPLSPLQQPQAAAVRPSIASYGSSTNPSVKASLDGGGASLPTLTEVATASSVGRTAEAAMKARKHAIRRQVRGLFAYPVAYILFWIMPFVMHCMNYMDRYAKNPLFPVALLAAISTTSLGLVDVIIFCWRERPWRHIPMSDGTFVGSFCFWRFRAAVARSRSSSVASGIVAAEARDAALGRGGELIGFFKNVVHFKRLSSSAGTFASGAGGSDRKVRENEGAQARLRLEKQEMQEKAALAATGSRVSSSEQGEVMGTSPGKPKSPGARNWFDQDLHDDAIEEVAPEQR